MTIRVQVFKADASRIPPKRLEKLMPVIVAPASGPGMVPPAPGFALPPKKERSKHADTRMENSTLDGYHDMTSDFTSTRSGASSRAPAKWHDSSSSLQHDDLSDVTSDYYGIAEYARPVSNTTYTYTSSSSTPSPRPSKEHLGQGSTSEAVSPSSATFRSHDGPSVRQHKSNRIRQVRNYSHSRESTAATDTSQIFEVSDEMYPSPTNGSLTTESDHSRKQRSGQHSRQASQSSFFNEYVRLARESALEPISEPAKSKGSGGSLRRVLTKLVKK